MPGLDAGDAAANREDAVIPDAAFERDGAAGRDSAAADSGEMNRDGGGSGSSGGGGSGGGGSGGAAGGSVVSYYAEFLVQPRDTHTGFAMSAFTVRLRASDGSTPAESRTVRLAIESGPSLTALAGQTSVESVQGLARFSNVRVTEPGAYTLRASAFDATSRVSEEFDVADVNTIGGSGRLFVVTESNALMSFEAHTPNRPFLTQVVRPLASDEQVVGLDFRPANGLLYALTRQGVFAQLYTVDPAQAVVTGVGGGFELSGVHVGFDFDPQLDRIHIVSDSGANLQVDPESGAVIETGAAVSYVGTDTHAGNSPKIVATAYSNNLPGAPAQLYAVDSATNSLVRVADASTQSLGVLATVGSLGVDVSEVAAFDITGPGRGRAFAALNVVASSQISTLCIIDLSTGAATTLGAFDVEERIVALAVDAPTIYAVRDGEALVSFSAQRPGMLLSAAAISSWTPGPTLAMDFDPINGGLYTVATDGVIFSRQSAGWGSAIANPLDPPLSGNRFDIDIDPVDRRYRIVTDTGQNLRGLLTSLEGPTVDGVFDTSDLHPVAIAYGPNVSGVPSSSLYGIDPAADVLVRVDSPATPSVSAIGSLGIDLVEVGGFDVGPDGLAYLSGIATPATTPALYSVDLETGEAALIGAIGGSASITSIAVPTGTYLEFYGTRSGNEFVRIDAYNAAVYGGDVVAGLQPNETIASIDYWLDGAAHRLLAVSNQARLYQLSEQRVDPLRFPNVPIATLAGTKISMDFDPYAKMLRIVTNVGENLRVVPATGVVTTDSPLAYAVGDVNEGLTPNIVAIAHTDTLVGTARTTAYALDATRDQLVRIGGVHGSPSPNSGVLTTVGNLGVDIVDNGAFDISPGGTTLIAAGSELRTVNLATGATERVSTRDVTPQVQSLAIWLTQNDRFY